MYYIALAVLIVVLQGANAVLLYDAWRVRMRMNSITHIVQFDQPWLGIMLVGLLALAPVALAVHFLSPE